MQHNSHVTAIPHLPFPNSTLVNWCLVFPITPWQVWPRLKPDASVHQPPRTLWVALQKFWKNLPVYRCLPLLSKFTNNRKDETRLKSFVKPSPLILWKCEKSSPVFSSFRKNKAITHRSASQCLWNQNVFPRKRSVSAASCSVIQSSGWAARGPWPPKRSFGNAGSEKAKR